MRNKFYDQQAFEILKGLYYNLVGHTAVVNNYGDYIAVYEQLRDFFKTDTDFQNAIYKDIFMNVGTVVWEGIEKASDPFGFIQTSMDELNKVSTIGYVFDRPITGESEVDKYFLAPKEGDDGVAEDKLIAMNEKMWIGKDFPVEARGCINRFKIHDALNYYRIPDETATDPYRLYSAFAEIKKTWLNIFKNHLAGWNRVAFYNMVFTTYLNDSTVTNAPRKVNLITEYNAKFGKSLTKDTWMLEGNIEHFAPWCYIRINQILREFGYDNEEFMTDNTTEFRGKTYSYHYACTTPATCFLEEPFALMKSYSNAQVYNEDLFEKVNVKRIDFWERVQERDAITTGSYLRKTANGYETITAETKITDLLGVIYDKRAIASAVADEHYRDTGLNPYTEAGVLHAHATMANHYNPMLKAVCICLA